MSDLALTRRFAAPFPKAANALFLLLVGARLQPRTHKWIAAATLNDTDTDVART